MSKATAMYGIEAYDEVRSDEAMEELQEFLAGHDPEVRRGVEKRLRRKYQTFLESRDWQIRNAFQQQMLQAQAPYQGVSALGNVTSIFGSILR